MRETLLPKVTDDETLEALAEAIAGVLKHWRLDEPEQQRLLMTGKNVRCKASLLRNDTALLERIGHLLAVDRMLTAHGLPSWWIRTPHPALFGESPLAAMLAQDISGIKKVRAILEDGDGPR